MATKLELYQAFARRVTGIDGWAGHSAPAYRDKVKDALNELNAALLALTEVANVVKDHRCPECGAPPGWNCANLRKVAAWSKDITALAIRKMPHKSRVARVPTPPRGLRG